MRPLITIVVPAYNVSKYISQCISSILEQTYKNIEVIVIDDGSTDDTLQECKRFSDPRLHVLSQVNQGLVRTRKNGLNIANGEWIGFVDGDDWIEPDMYESLVDRISDRVDMVHSGIIWGETKKECSLLDGEYKFSDTSARKAFFEKNILDAHDRVKMYQSLCVKLIRTQVAKKWYSYVPDDVNYGEDLLFCAYAIRNIKGLVVDKDAYYHYRLRNNSLTHEKRGQLNNEIELMRTIYRILSEEYGEKPGEIYEEELCGRVLRAIRNEYQLKEFIHLYRIDNIELYRNKKIVLYSAGIVGTDFYAELCKYRDVEIVAWVDKGYAEKNCKYRCVEPVERVMELEYDAIIVAMLDENDRRQVRNELKKMGVDVRKVNIDQPKRIIP